MKSPKKLAGFEFTQSAKLCAKKGGLAEAAFCIIRCVIGKLAYSLIRLRLHRNMLWYAQSNRARVMNSLTSASVNSPFPLPQR